MEPVISMVSVAGLKVLLAIMYFMFTRNVTVSVMTGPLFCENEMSDDKISRAGRKRYFRVWKNCFFIKGIFSDVN